MATKAQSAEGSETTESGGGEVRRRDRIAESISGDDTEIDKTIRILRREKGTLRPEDNGGLSTTVRPDA